MQTLSFTYGESSEIGFVNDLEEAAADAAYAVVTVSPQTYTVQVTSGTLQDRPGPGRGGRNVEHGGLRLESSPPSTPASLAHALGSSCQGHGAFTASRRPHSYL